MFRNTLIIEDDVNTQQWLHDIVLGLFPESTIEICGDVTSAKEQARIQSFDLAIVDISLPDGCGIDLIPLLQKHSPLIVSIVATVFDDSEQIFKALQAGAKGYLLKDDSVESFTQALANIQKGHPPLSPSVARKVLNFFNASSSFLPKEENVDNLTKRESEVLILVAKGYSRAEIGELLRIKPNTVSGYIKVVYQKLGVMSKAEAALEARRLGLV